MAVISREDISSIWKCILRKCHYWNRKFFVMTVKTWVFGHMFTITKRSTTVLRPVGNRSAIDRPPDGDWKPPWDSLQPLRLVGDHLLTGPRPPCDHQKLFYDWFDRREVLLATSKTSFRPNRPCDSCNLSATSVRPPTPLCDRGLWYMIWIASYIYTCHMIWRITELYFCFVPYIQHTWKYCVTFWPSLRVCVGELIF